MIIMIIIFNSHSIHIYTYVKKIVFPLFALYVVLFVWVACTIAISQVLVQASLDHQNYVKYVQTVI